MLDDVPESVQGIIAARLDGLARDEKELLQDAAVVGKVFWSGALAQMRGRERQEIEAALHSLERKEFVRRERRSSVAAETEFAFRHILVRDVAYGQIPRGARAERHAKAAEWIESLGRPADHAELLAHHYISAIELAQLAGRSTDTYSARARTALRDAGDRALSLNAFAPAARYLTGGGVTGIDWSGPLSGKSLALVKTNNGPQSFVDALLDATKLPAAADTLAARPQTKVYLWQFDSSKASPIAAIAAATPAVLQQYPPIDAGVVFHHWTPSQSWQLLGGCTRYRVVIAGSIAPAASTFGLASNRACNAPTPTPNPTASASPSK